MAGGTIVYHDEDANLDALKDATLAVIGYGNQGRAQALNLRDSGLPVIIGNVEDEYRKEALTDGFTVLPIAEAATRGDVLLLLLPDEVAPHVYTADIKPHLQSGDALVFASGYNVTFGGIVPPSTVDVLLLAPRMIGVGVRENFLHGRGFPSLVGVHQDASGQAKARLLALAKGIGSTRSGCLEVSMAEEAHLDLFTEQAFGPAFGAAFMAAIETLIEAGYPPEAVLLELYMSGELAYTLQKFVEIGAIQQMDYHSHTSQYGSLTRSARFADLNLKERMKEILQEIRSGKFAREWSLEQEKGLPLFRQLKEMLRQHPLSAWEHRMREAFHRAKW